MESSEKIANLQDPSPLPLWLKAVYGSGDWGLATFATLRTVFFGIFMADVVGLNLRLASLVLLFGIMWDAANDLLVGTISDRVQTRWGPRRPFLLWFAVPFGLSFLLMWTAPGWQSQAALLAHVAIAYAVSDTLWTLVALPYFALTPELTPDYDERTSLTTYRMLFNLVASLVTAVAAPQIIRSAPTARTGYVLVAAIFGLLAIVPFLALFFATSGRVAKVHTEAAPLRETFKAAWKNIPFRFITLIHLLNWVAVDLFAFMLPFYILYWLESGAQSPMLDVPWIGSLAVESAILGLILGPAALALPLWLYLSRRINKHVAYIAGLSIWIVAQAMFLLVQPGQRDFALVLAFVAGMGISAAHVLPDAIFPDIMEWDELLTGQKRVGAFYGIRTFVRKVATAVALAVASQILGMSGYQSPPAGAGRFQQMPETLQTIRLLIGAGVTALLVLAVATALFYPLNREKHARVRTLLARRRKRQASRRDLVK